MQRLNNKKGLTLVEIIVAIAIIGMLVIGISGMLDLSVKQIFHAGARTQETMVIQEVADLLQDRNNSNIPNDPFETTTEIQNFLSTYQTDPVYQTTYQITWDGAHNGWNVTISKAISNGTRTAEISTFVVNHY